MTHEELFEAVQVDVQELNLQDVDVQRTLSRLHGPRWSSHVFFYRGRDQKLCCEAAYGLTAIECLEEFRRVVLPKVREALGLAACGYDRIALGC